MSSSSPPQRPRRPRADARRNVERLLTAAETTFGTHGIDAPLEQIARLAGVAIGTLYGHFPNRRALLAAVLRTRNEELFALGDALTEREPATALTTWIHAVVEHAAAYQGLAGALLDGAGDEASELHASCARMAAIGERLVTRAQAAGTIHASVSGEDVFGLMNAAAWLHEHASAQQAGRLVQLALAGMRTAAGVDVQ